ncbi:hypothetical protein, partial [Salmonella sp. s54836]|uniref:hypothetical protein n=1 Tax=Salmonella sp. s54836 TaxID=3159673 RepID=UPI003981711A
NQVPETMYLGKMFIQLFYGIFPFDLVLRIWDAMFLDGPGVIIAASLLILKLNRKNLLSLREHELLEYLTLMGSQLEISHDKFMEELQELVDILTKDNHILPEFIKAPNIYQLFQN